MAANLTASGYTTPGTWWADLDDEPTPELRWPLSVNVFHRMRTQDAQVISVLRAVSLPIRRTGWWVEQGGASLEVTRLVADDLGLPVKGEDPRPVTRTRDRFSWSEHLRLALLMLSYGHAYFEQVYRIDEDGRARLRKLLELPARTISEVNVARDGGLVNLKQHESTGGAQVTIPVDRIVAYVNEKEGGNWLGQSLLRSAYKNWLIKDRLLRADAQTIERNGMGVPRYTGPDYGPDRESAAADLDRGLTIAKSWRSGDAAGAAIPFGSQLDLVGVSGTLPQALPSIRYHDEQIARAVLAHFLNLGTQTGSWALGTTFADFFVLSLQSVAEDVASVANRHIVEDLVDLNYGETEPAPQVVFDEIGSQQVATSQALKALFDAGILLPDRPLEEAVRQQYGLPPKGTPTPAVPAPAAPAPMEGAPSE